MSAVDFVIGQSIVRQVERARARATRRTSLDELLSEVAAAGEAVIRRKAGATDEEIAELECALGCGLPDAYRSLVRRFGYLDVANVAVLGIAPRKPRYHVLAERKLVQRQLRELEGELPDSESFRAVATAIRRLVPLVRIGPNDLLYGEGLFADDRGRCYRVSKDEQVLMARVPTAEKKGFDLETFLVEAIRAANA